MRPQDSVWQGHFGYWQNLFIHQNILTIGYTAWNGYIGSGRGLVVCEVSAPVSMNWSLESPPCHLSFIPQSLIAQYLQALEWEDEALRALSNAIATYDPTEAIVVLVIGNGEVDLNLLQDLAISPAHCFEQVQHRWAEFQLDCTTQTKSP